VPFKPFPYNTNIGALFTAAAWAGAYQIVHII
jgi:hypothetical protein